MLSLETPLIGMNTYAVKKLFTSALWLLLPVIHPDQVAVPVTGHPVTWRKLLSTHASAAAAWGW